MATNTQQPPHAVRIDQVLHGYDRGHRELATSAALDDRARATMMVFSDLLATAALPEDASYLTAYPLHTSSKHVIARTWGAGPNYRPGSVWTHSLVLDYQALALLPDLVALQSLFTQPSSARSFDYTSPLYVSADASIAVPAASGARALDALIQLYGDLPVAEAIVLTAGVAADESLALALWRQMWPAMRRDFAFVTCESDRQLDVDASCVLRFAGPARWERERKGVSAPSSGHLVLAADLPLGASTPLRRFLARYAIEGVAPRSLALQLAEQWLPSNDVDLAGAWTLARNNRLPRLRRDVAIQRLETLSKPEEMIDLVDALKNEVLPLSLPALVDRSATLSDTDFAQLLAVTQPSSGDEFGAGLLKAIIKTAPLDRVAAVSADVGYDLVLHERPEALQCASFWPVQDQDRANVVSAVFDQFVLPVDKALGLFADTLGPQTADVILRRARSEDAVLVASLLGSANDAVREVAANWFVRTPYRLLEYARNAANVPCPYADDLANTVIKTGLSLSANMTAAWSALLEKVTDNCTGKYVSMIGFLVALGSTDDASLGLAGRFYDTLLAAVRNDEFSRNEKAYFAARLDYYSRLPKAVAAAAAKRWPLSSRSAGALCVSNEDAHLDDLIKELVLRQGKDKLSSAIRGGQLPRLAEQRAKLYLNDVYSHKFWPFW